MRQNNPENNLVCVLMSTYNGEKYIREQIDSILAQEEVSVLLLIRDDGSSDNTKKVIREYGREFSNIHLFVGENCGVGHSFYELMKIAYNDYPADYYAFADQDDVWMKYKLISAIRVIENARNKKYNVERLKLGVAKKNETNEQKEYNNDYWLYTSNLELVDNDLKRIGLYFLDSPQINLYSSIFGNVLSGCTMVFTLSLLQLCIKIGKPNEIILHKKNHDAWLAYIAFLSGYVLYDKTSYIKYRQHGENVVGGIHNSGFKLLFHRMSSLIKRRGAGVVSLVATELMDKMNDFCSDDEMNDLSVISHAKGIRGGVCILKNKKIFQSVEMSRIEILLYTFLKWF